MLKKSKSLKILNTKNLNHSVVDTLRNDTLCKFLRKQELLRCLDLPGSDCGLFAPNGELISLSRKSFYKTVHDCNGLFRNTQMDIKSIPAGHETFNCYIYRVLWRPLESWTVWWMVSNPPLTARRPQSLSGRPNICETHASWRTCKAVNS